MRDYFARLHVLHRSDEVTGTLTIDVSIIARDKNSQLPEDIKVIQAIAYHDQEQWDMSTSRIMERHEAQSN